MTKKYGELSLSEIMGEGCFSTCLEKDYRRLS
jgi:hypothetical protein